MKIINRFYILNLKYTCFYGTVLDMSQETIGLEENHTTYRFVLVQIGHRYHLGERKKMVLTIFYNIYHMSLSNNCISNTYMEIKDIIRNTRSYNRRVHLAERHMLCGFLLSRLFLETYPTQYHKSKCISNLKYRID
jgi:hypothetical protein